MSEENVDVVRRGVEALNRRDVDALLADASPDIEWEDSVFWTEPTRIYRGEARVREWFNECRFGSGKRFAAPVTKSSLSVD